MNTEDDKTFKIELRQLKLYVLFFSVSLSRCMCFNCPCTPQKRNITQYINII